MTSRRNETWNCPDPKGIYKACLDNSIPIGKSITTYIEDLAHHYFGQNKQAHSVIIHHVFLLQLEKKILSLNMALVLEVGEDGALTKVKPFVVDDGTFFM